MEWPSLPVFLLRSSEKRLGKEDYANAFQAARELCC